jgi:hypothetical protein
VKAHRGRALREQIYALCIKEVGEDAEKGYCEVLHNRSALSILSIIHRIVIPGTKIHTDEWSPITNYQEAVFSNIQPYVTNNIL